MRFLILLLLNGCAALTFDTAISDILDISGFNETRMIYRLPKDIIPTSYVINLDVLDTLNTLDFKGWARIAIVVKQPTNKITFHNHKLMVNLFKSSLISVYDNKVLKFVMREEYQTETMTLIVDKMLHGRYILDIQYKGTLSHDDDCLFRTNSSQANKMMWLIATQFKPNKARRLFPCWDEPTFIASFDIAVKHSNNYTVLSNMPLLIKEPFEEHGMTRTYFQSTPAIPTYLVTLAMTNVDCISNSTFLLVWGSRNLRRYLEFTLSMVDKIKTILNDYTDITPLDSFDLNFILMPGEFKTIRSWGLVIYSERSLIFDYYNSNFQEKIDVATAIAHEMIPIWFNNVVHLSLWTEEWLSKGIAMCIQHHVLQKVFPKWPINDISVTKTLQEAFHKNVDFSKHSIITSTIKKFGENERMHLFHEYTSDFILIRMLQHVITEETFKKGVRRYLSDYMYKSATLDDFWNTMQNVLDFERRIVSNNTIPIQNLMASWLKKGNYPLLTTLRDYNNGQIVILQRPFNCETYTSCAVKRWIPVAIAAQSSFNHSDTLFNHTYPKYWLHPEYPHIIIDGYNKTDWIIVNLQQIGFYRVNYDDTNWVRLVKALNSVRYTDIHVINRAQLIDDAHYLMENSIQFNPNIFFDLVGYLKREENYEPWYSMARILEEMSLFFYLPESQYSKTRFLEIFKDVLKDVGYDNREYDRPSTINIRSLITYWACRLGYDKCLETAAKRLNAHLKDPKNHKILPSQKYWTYCMGMKGGNIDTADEMFHKYNKTKDMDILKYMTCTTNKDILLHLLEVMKPDHSFSVSVEDRNEFYNQLVKRQVYNNTILNYLLKNFNGLGMTYSTSSDTKRIIDFIKNVYSIDQVHMIIKFVATSVNTLDISWDEINIAKRTKITEIEKIINYGSRFNPPNLHHV